MNKGHTVHRSIFVCNFLGCQKHFKTKFSMNRHKVVHTKDKKFECEYCGKRFALYQYLKEHIYIHTNDKPYVCGIGGCKKCFRQTGKLSLHRKSHKEIIQVRLSNKTMKRNSEQATNKLIDVFSKEKIKSKLPSVEVEYLPQKLGLQLREGSVKSAETLDTKESKIKEINCEIISNTKNTSITHQKPSTNLNNISVELKEGMKILFRFNNTNNFYLDNTVPQNCNKRLNNETEQFLNYLEHIDSGLNDAYRPILPIPEILKRELDADVGKN